MFGPGRIYPGGVARVTVTFTDSNGDAVDPTTVTFRLMTPCHVESSYVYGTDSELTQTATGNYQMLVPSTLLDRGGRYHYRWQTTGTGTTTALEGVFTVTSSPFFDDCCSDYRAYNG